MWQVVESIWNDVESMWNDVESMGECMDSMIEYMESMGECMDSIVEYMESIAEYMEQKYSTWNPPGMWGQGKVLLPGHTHSSWPVTPLGSGQSTKILARP